MSEPEIDRVDAIDGVRTALESAKISGVDLRGYASEVARIHRKAGREGLQMLDDLRNERIGRDLVARLYGACAFQPEIDAFDFSVPTGAPKSVLVIITVKRYEVERRRVLIVIFNDTPIDYMQQYLNRFESIMKFSENVFLVYAP